VGATRETIDAPIGKTEADHAGGMIRSRAAWNAVEKRASGNCDRIGHSYLHMHTAGTRMPALHVGIQLTVFDRQSQYGWINGSLEKEQNRSIRLNFSTMPMWLAICSE
jgi:hypothetical protein